MPTATTAPRVVSAISGGAPRPWYYATTADEQRAVIDRQRAVAGR
jgi:hypothetical protein